MPKEVPFQSAVEFAAAAGDGGNPLAEWLAAQEKAERKVGRTVRLPVRTRVTGHTEAGSTPAPSAMIVLAIVLTQEYAYGERG